MQFFPGMATLAADYDGFILDLWGVIHDGVQPYPGAADCLRRLRDAGKSAVMLSNAPRRVAVAQTSLRAMGISDDLYTGIMTSGEATHLLLRDRTDPWFAALGRRVYHLGPARDHNVFQDLDLELVARPEDADFVLNTGPDDAGGATDLADWEGLLQDFRRHNLKMICANPDLEVMRGPLRLICAGLLTQRYEALGGEARWVGKPNAAVYAPVQLMLGVPTSRILAVGDTPRTDLAGAAGVGIDSCWVLGGIHAADFPNPDAAIAHARAAGFAPRALVQSFSW